MGQGVCPEYISGMWFFFWIRLATRVWCMYAGPGGSKASTFHFATFFFFAIAHSSSCSLYHAFILSVLPSRVNKIRSTTPLLLQTCHIPCMLQVQGKSSCSSPRELPTRSGMPCWDIRPVAGTHDGPHGRHVPHKTKSSCAYDMCMDASFNLSEASGPTIVTYTGEECQGWSPARPKTCSPQGNWCPLLVRTSMTRPQRPAISPRARSSSSNLA